MSKLSIRDLDMQGKRVFIRVDFNVPMTGGKCGRRHAHPRDAADAAPGSGARRAAGSRVASRTPQGQGQSEVFSLAPVAARLRELLGGKPVGFAADCVGPDAEAKSKALRDGEVLLLENVRFHPEEEANDAEFSQQALALCDGLFVCDAFGSAHRAHASVVGITKFVRQSAAGLLDGKGARLPRQSHFASRSSVRRGAGRRESFRQDRSGAEPDEAGGRHADRRRHGLHFLEVAGPADREVARRKRQARPCARFAGGSEAAQFPAGPAGGPRAGRIARLRGDASHRHRQHSRGLDGARHRPARPIDQFRSEISNARTIVWNGPLGMFEKPAFAQGTLAIARAVAAATSKGATSIIGGGDSVAAVEQSGVATQISHISTGGGASLEFLAGEKLPGVEALTDKP